MRTFRKSRKTRQRTARIVAAAALLIAAGPVRGAEIYEFYTGVRQLGMGGAYTAVVNDETSLLTNPAGLGKLRDVTLTLADPELSIGSKNTDAATATEILKTFSLEGLQETLRNSQNTHWHTKGQAFPSFVMPNFGIGVHAKWQTDAEVTTNNYRLDYTNDYAVALGGCIRIFDGIIKLGFAGRAVNRAEIHKDLNPATTGVSVASQGKEGGGIAADIGMIITAPIVALPSIAVVARDVGSTSYTLSKGMLYSTAERPTMTPQTFDAGFSLSPILSNNTRLQFTADYHDIGNLNDNADVLRRVHVGAELNLADFLFLRVGMNQRYLTGGFEFATEGFQLQAATYGEEIGTSAQPREDRRFVGKFSIRF